jgi:hypothetical protein
MKKPLPENHIELVDVESSNIRSIGYRESDKTMRVKFHNGDVYEYHPVTKKQYEGVLYAESVGSSFSTSIRNNKNIKAEKILN